MRLLLSKFCEYATQQQNGRHSMVGIFDNIIVPEFPIDHPPFFLCIQMEFDPNESEQDMDVLALLIDEDGNDVGEDYDAADNRTYPGALEYYELSGDGAVLALAFARDGRTLFVGTAGGEILALDRAVFGG